MGPFRLRSTHSHPRSDDTVDEDDQTLNVAVFIDLAFATLAIEAALAITDDIGQQQQQAADQDPYADLIVYVRQRRNNPNGVHNKSYADRWDRALLALGVMVFEK